MSSQPPGIPSLCRKYVLPLILVSNAVVSGRVGAAAKSTLGYVQGQSIPVSCLNRDISTGEHITDPSGKLQYIPFPTCNETAAPLSFRYGVSETITCTINSLSDSLYHLLEYYVHSDVPLTCRIPTFPLSSLRYQNKIAGSSGEEKHDDVVNNSLPFSSQTPFTPLTIALQGTLQLSHLHIWTEMNVLMHKTAQLSPGFISGWKKSKKSKKDTKKKVKGSKRDKISPPQGQIVAGSAYSVPLVLPAAADEEDDVDSANDKKTRNKKDMMDPWTTEGGTKVICGEPLVFTFRVGWVSHGDVLGLVGAESSSSSPSSTSGSGLFIQVMTICFWVGVVFGLAVAVERVRQRKRGRYKGDGILGHRPFFGGLGAAGVGGSGVVGFGGDKGRMNGYGYVLGLNGGGNGSGGVYGGYGGYGVGKND
ncbi:hypothetical protein ACO22_04809 [Paracoccidioides brasiliensis]|uniref:Uncharacterized protein n=1 Tax=Paracoccidioides brasiliensis TaxID=121759 RepID=A0A1D2JC23_PARBR|nr:hypothetical protein ACO22_04809 [Paracoccidioides brasiliensis]